MVFYLDTSAFVKFVAIEEFSTSLREWVQQMEPELVSSDLLRIEALRAARRLGPEYLKAAREALQHVHLIALTSRMCEAAADLDPAILRSLDAAHLATALSIGDDVFGDVTYDQRFSDACNQLGLRVVTPGL
jgi:predicted nucleic acid-binding protein